MRGRAVVIACPRPWHGLGNRIRSVLGTRALAAFTGRGFAYAWPTGRRFGARLDQLWQVDDRRVPVWWSQSLAARHPYRDETLGWLDAARDERVWQVRTAHALALPPGAPSWADELRTLRPVETVGDRVRDFARARLEGRPYVGVMVRTHAVAHAETQASSPVAWYVTRLRELRSAHPDLPYFVSADTPQAQEQLLRAVPGGVGLTGKGAYNSRAALQASVADLYLLAGSVHVLGAHYSSFPELAVALAGDGLRLETPRSAAATRFDADALSGPADPLRPYLRAAVALAG